MDAEYDEDMNEVSKKKRMTAPLLRRIVKEDRGLNGYYLTEEKDKMLFAQIENIVRELPPCEIDMDYRRFWFSIPRGPIEDFGDFNDEDEDWGSYEDFVSSWKYYHPDESDWYVFFYERMPDGRSYLGINGLVIFSDERDNTFRNQSIYHTDLLRWLIGIVREQVDSIKAGTYRDRVIRELPIGYRKGVVKRSDVWESGYWTREMDLEGTTDEDIEAFTELTNHGIEEKPVNRLPSMTVNDYLKYCSLCFRIRGEIVEGLTLIQQYKRFADGRDDGMLDIDMDDPDAFMSFRKMSHDGHVWEIRAGHGFSRMHLYPVNDEKGWYFVLRGCFDRSDFIHITLRFSEKRIPLMICDAKKIVDALRGEDYIGIVPRGDHPFYASSRFSNHNVMDCISFNDELHEKLKDKIEWYDVDTFYPFDPNSKKKLPWNK